MPLPAQLQGGCSNVVAVSLVTTIHFTMGSYDIVTKKTPLEITSGVGGGACLCVGVLVWVCICVGECACVGVCVHVCMSQLE